MSDLMSCQDKLISEAENKGYLTFDDIMDIADTFMLSVSEVDKLSEGIQLRGIIVYEDVPASSCDDDTLEDYSRVDYDAIFKEIITISPELEFIVNLVKELPPPQYGEVQALAVQAINGNEFAQERILLIHLRLSLKIALSTSKQYKFDLADAVSAAFIGLVVGVKKYDPNGFSTFQSYASTWIYQSITRFCTPTWMEYYYPVHYKQKMFSVLDAYEQYYGEIPDDSIHEDFVSYAMEKVDMTKEQVEEYLAAILTQIYRKVELNKELPEVDADAYCETETHYVTLYNILDNAVADIDYGLDPFEYACKSDLIDCVHKLLTKLSQREQDVLQLRFGMRDGHEWTLEEVGVEFGVTRERIRQIEAKALRKLRHVSNAKHLKDFYA